MGICVSTVRSLNTLYPFEYVAGRLSLFDKSNAITGRFLFRFEPERAQI